MQDIAFSVSGCLRLLSGAVRRHVAEGTLAFTGVGVASSGAVAVFCSR
jgi:hypothetical protein